MSFLKILLAGGTIWRHHGRWPSVQQAKLYKDEEKKEKVGGGALGSVDLIVDLFHEILRHS